MPLAILVCSIVVGGTSAIALMITTQRTRQNKNIRKMLPNDLDFWRVPGRKPEDEERIWAPLVRVFQEGGLTLWPIAFPAMLKAPNDSSDGFPLSSGYAYAASHRGVSDGIGTAWRLNRYMYINGLTRVVRTREGYDATIRVIAIKDEGHEHLKILRKIAVAPLSLLSSNHTLPLLSEFRFEDIIFGIFPKVGGTMEAAFYSWPKNSVGDVMDMLLQALEGLAFIHASNIAHRDAFHDNFLVQWQPESLRTMRAPLSRPRVYLIDFEVAVEFSSECLPKERVCTGYPLGGSFTEAEMYSRPLAPEMTASTPYCPFKLDIWQLGSSFLPFKTNIEAIDLLLRDLACPDPASRMNADTALEKFGNVISNMPPASLLIEPTITINKN